MSESAAVERSTTTDCGELSVRERLFVAIARDVCRQELGALREHVHLARAAGVAPCDLKEALLHLVIYASFPKVLCALRALEQRVTPLRRRVRAEPPTPVPDENLFLQPRVRTSLERIDSDFADLAVRMGGEIWSRSKEWFLT